MTALPDFGAEAVERARRCIVTGEIRSDAELVRFVVGPDNAIVPDVAAKLPGRGLWVTSQRDIIERAVTRECFRRAAKGPVTARPDLPAHVEALLVARMAGDLGLARRSAQLVMGFDAVARAFAGPRPPAVLIEASDGASDGKRKLRATAGRSGPAVIDCLSGAELSLALGRENVVHAALKSGRLSERLIRDAGRLRGFRPAMGYTHAANKGQE